MRADVAGNIQGWKICCARFINPGVAGFKGHFRLLYFGMRCQQCAQLFFKRLGVCRFERATTHKGKA